MTKIFNYTYRSLIAVKEGYRLRDKLTLFYFLFVLLPKHILTRGRSYSNRLPSTVTLKNKHGIFYCGNELSSVRTLYSIAEPETSKFLKLTNGVFIDIGANAGKYSIKIANDIKRSGGRGRVIAIEPEEINFSKLKKNIELNGLGQILTPVQVGCFSRKGKLKFYLADRGGEMHSLVRGDKTRKSVTINVDTLDNVTSTLKLEKIDLIKIDVEGAEPAVLLGARKVLKKFHPKIVIESLTQETTNNIKKLLKPYGYTLKRILDDHNLVFE